MKCRKLVAILLMFCVIIAVLIEETESKNRKLCKFKKAKNKCVDITSIPRKERRRLRRQRKRCQTKKDFDTCKKLFHKKRRHLKQKPGRCEEVEGTCQRKQKGQTKDKCICVLKKQHDF